MGQFRGAWGLLAGVACGLGFTPAALASTFDVNSTADTLSSINHCASVGGTCTLRDAIASVASADATSPGSNTIEFIVCGPFVVSSPLPHIPGESTIDGSGVANAGCTDAGAGSPNYGYANIDGHGPAAGAAAGFPGLIFDGSGSTMSSIAINGFTQSIELGGTGKHHIYYDAIGADPFEQGVLMPQSTGDGIEVLPGSANDTIGYAPNDGNNNYQDDIFGNLGWGVRLDPGSGPTTVGHNFIGTDTSGHAAGPGDGKPLGNGLGGVLVGDASGSVVGGTVQCHNAADTCDSNVIANNVGPGVELASGSAGATVASNYIGQSLNFYNTPLTDGGALPNTGAGIKDAGSANTIGGTPSGAGNMISGNSGDGVLLEGSHAMVQSNLVGLNLAGTAATPNGGAGVRATDAAGVSPGNNRISGNVVGGNHGSGVELDQSGNTVIGNFIGTAGDHTSPLPNGLGLLARRGPQEIGTPTGGANTIANNTGAGIAVVDPPGGSVHTSGVLIYRNSIFANGGLGIDLGNDGVTSNHPLGATAGPNGWQNFPVITSASAANGQYAVHGTLDTAPNGYFSVYLFANTTCDPSGYGQGQTVINAGTLSTDANGHANFVLTGNGLAPGAALSATAVGLGSSEFAQCVPVGGGVDLMVSQAVAAGGKVIANEPVDVVIHIANNGPAKATNIVLTDTLPQDGKLVSQPAGCPPASGGQFRCSVGDLTPGSAQDLHVLLQPGDVQTLTNSVRLDADQVQTTPGDGSSAFAAAVTPNPSGGTGGPINQPQPTFGQFVRLDRERGTVTATLPNGQVIQLRNFALVPIGTVVETTGGVARVTAAVPGKRKTSYADFKFGRFRIGQSRIKGGLVDAIMNGSLRACAANELRTSADRATAAAKGNRRGRRRSLWGHAHGRFTITGNRGAATVRGTIWQVIDTCKTTTVVVKQGVVDVTGFGHTKPKHATVRAGHRVTLRAG